MCIDELLCGDRVCFVNFRVMLDMLMTCDLSGIFIVLHSTCYSCVYATFVYRPSYSTSNQLVMSLEDHTVFDV